MRALIIVILVVVVMVLIGWLTFTFRENSATVTFDPQKIEHDTQEAVQEGKEFLNDAGQAIDRAVEEPAESNP